MVFISYEANEDLNPTEDPPSSGPFDYASIMNYDAMESM
jgi:hypothetical protein